VASMTRVISSTTPTFTSFAVSPDHPFCSHPRLRQTHRAVTRIWV
jgi:hypothetical protein